jgi:hypothetical protein
MRMMEQPPLPGIRRAAHVGAMRCVFTFCEHCRARVSVPADPGDTLPTLRTRLSDAMAEHHCHYHPDVAEPTGDR